MALLSESTHPQAAADATIYRALFDGAYDAILLYDEHGQLFDCNQRALELLGTTRPVLLSAGLMGFVRAERTAETHWGSEAGLREAVLHCARSGQPASRVWYGQRPDGALLDGWVTLHRLPLPPEQRVLVQLTLRDVTQTRRQDEARRHESTATRSREQLREVLSRADLGFLQLDREARIVDVNDFFLVLTGYAREQVLGQEYFSLFAPDEEREPRRYAYRRALELEELQDFFERSLLAHDRNRRTVYWYAEFVRDADGQLGGVMFVGRDVTKGQFTARALGESQTRLQDFLDNAHDLIQNLSIDNRFLFVNKAWKEKLGYSAEELSGLSLTDVVHPYYKAKLLYQLRNLYKGEKVNKLETVFLTKTGKPVHLIGSITCSWDDGEPVSTRAILHDITDRIKAERLQKVYYSIANLAISSKDLHSLYGAIHRELSKIIETNNFYIALCDEARTQLQFAYFVDQNSQGEKAMVMRPFSSGVSEYIIRTGKPQILLKPDLQALIADGTITAYGLMPEVMLCSPLSIGDRIIGVITVQDYAKPDAYAPSDLEILHFISNQVALAIERKRNEVQINKQNARLNAIFESGTHLMWSVDLKSRLTSFNRNYAAYFLRRNGVHPALNINLWHADLAMMEEDARQLFIEHYTRAFEGVPQRFEVRLRDVRGHDTWREIYLNPIYLDDGTFEEISGIAHDITDKKRSQLEMAAQEEKFRAIFESFQDIYYRTDERGVITIISPSTYDIMGYTPEEGIGRPVADFYEHPEHRADLLRELETGGGVVRNFETTLIHKLGHPVKVLVNARALYDERGRLAGIEGIARDVTDFKQMQDDLRRAKDEAEAALHAKTQFLANMSHELRTPMNGIIGMIDLLHQTVASEEQEEYIDTLRKSSDALLAILNDILDLSKIQAGKMELNEEGMDLHYTLEKIHSLFANRAQQKQLNFTYEITPHTPRFIITDETRLLQVLSNLTSNAIKFTQQGAVTVRATSVFTDGVEHTLRFEVRDSGIGISSDNAKLLFTNFTQLDTTPTKSFGGTGLGLAISKQLTELMGGRIGVDSTVGQGATFWFTIRCRVAENEQAILQERQAARDRSAVGVLRFEQAPRVLLVDDNPINQKVAVRLLDKLGCRTDVAGDGFEAIGLATSGAAYDVIFMDIQMPEMDGVTAMREIRRRLGAACPPVVAMTAYSMKEDAERFVQEGMDDYVPKPVKSQDLYEVLRRWRPQLAVAAGQAEPTAPAEAPEAPAVAEDAPVYAPDPRPVVDPATLAQLRELGGPEFAASLYADFEQEAGPLLDEAKALVQAGRYADILPHLHQLKGTGFTLGLTRLAEQTKHLEHELKEGRTQHATRDFQALLHYFAEFIHEYPARTSAP